MEIELAIFEDCSSLINKFVDCSDLSFKTFCQQWRERKFQYIYGVQTTAIEVIQTTKAIIHFAKRVACPNDEFVNHSEGKNDERVIARRIGGIYLIYAIYFKQPTNRYVKLLMSSETWQELTKFIECLPVNKIGDEVKYMFWHLYKEDAFRFTGCDYDLGLENMADYDKLYSIHNGNKCVDIVRENLRQKLIIVKETEQALPSMISLEDQYNITKESLYKVDLEKSLPLTKIFHDVNDAIKSIHDILDDKGGAGDSGPMKNYLNINYKRKELKRKAVGYITNDEDSSEEDKSQEAKRKEQHWSARRMIDQQLPEVIKADLINNTTDDEE